jgi:DNA-binding NtrC family response regulator
MLGLRTDERELREPLEGWVRRLGFRTRFTTDVREAVAWLSREDFAASIVDSWLGRDEGEEVWRTIRPVFARRTVLLARDHHRGLWFEALRSGVATVLPLPARESMVRAAVAAATHAWRGPNGRFATDTTSPQSTHPRSSPERARDAWDTN